MEIDEWRTDHREGLAFYVLDVNKQSVHTSLLDLETFINAQKKKCLEVHPSTLS